MIKKLFIGALISAFSMLAFAQSSIQKGLDQIHKNHLEGPLNFLASDWMQGREAGLDGARMAADYLATLMITYDLQPAGDDSSFFQAVPLRIASPTKQHVLTILPDNQNLEEKTFTPGLDLSSPILFNDLNVKGEVAYCGYGLDLPHFNEFNSLPDAPIILVRLQGVPEFDTSLINSTGISNDKKALYYSKYKAASARKIIAILEYNPNDSQAEIVDDSNKLHKRSSGIYNKNFALTDSKQEEIPVYKISQNILQLLFPNYKKLIKQTTKRAPKGLPGKPVFSDSQVHLQGQAKVLRTSCNNVLGKIEGSEYPDEIVVVGAHYDHLGTYDNRIWNGADDNASGVIGMLTIAKAFQATGVRPKRTVVFAAWTAEERGLLGSTHFVLSHPDVSTLKYYHNYDMVGRSKDPAVPDSAVAMMYTKSWARAGELVKEAVQTYQLPLKVNYSPWDNPVSGSDNASFAKKGIPIIWFHTGGHPDYHMPDDHTEKIDWSKLEGIVKASFVSLWHLAND
jgi:hypothetical protein